MKIAVIGAKGLPPKQGGIEHYCAEVYPRMVAKGHQVDFYARASITESSPFEPYYYQGVRVLSMPGGKMRGIDAFTSSALGALSALGNRYDIVHFHALGPSLFTWLPKISSSAKVVVTCQGLDWQREKWGKMSRTLIRMGERAAVRHADGLIVVSEELRSYFLQHYERKSVYIPNAAAGYVKSDPEFNFGKSLQLEPGRYMVFLGRLVPEKCPDLLLKAFKSLQPKGWKLVFVGGSSDTSSFTSALKQSAADNPNVLLAGELRGAYLAEIVRGAGLFVLPSNLEGLPLAMLEAMQEGIPILASDIPPHCQLLGDDRGVLFQMDDVSSLIQNMDWATTHPEEMQTMAQKAQRYVQVHHCWDKITADNLRLYESLLGVPKVVRENVPVK